MSTTQVSLELEAGDGFSCLRKGPDNWLFFRGSQCVALTPDTTKRLEAAYQDWLDLAVLTETFGQ